MAARTTSWLSLPSLLRTLVAHARLSFRLLRDPAVPFFVKLVPLAAVLYLLWPIDGLPDFIPALGQLDDVGVLVLALESFLRLCPESVVAFHRSALATRQGFTPAPGTSSGTGTAPGPDQATGPIIDAEFRRDDR